MKTKSHNRLDAGLFRERLDATINLEHSKTRYFTNLGPLPNINRLGVVQYELDIRAFRQILSVALTNSSAKA
jgi:hypothetical protein